MKKFIILFAGLILAFVSCTPKVEKDIKKLTAGEFKVLDVKSVDIKNNFYTITEEYNSLKANYESAVDEKSGWISLVARTKVYMDGYQEGSDRYNTFKKLYDENKASLDSVVVVCNGYYSKIQNLEKNAGKGKIYIAKLRGKDEYTGKDLDFNSYQIFAYNSDRSLHQVEFDNPFQNIEMVCSVYPKAKKDIKKAMGKLQEMFVGALSELDF